MAYELISFCRRCLYSSTHPLGLVLDDEGICSGCRIHEEKDQLDWGERFDRLIKLVKPYRSLDGRNYDCVVPVNGAGDSYFIVDVVKNKLGLNPLLVSYNKYWNTECGIWNLANLRSVFNCDILIQNVNPISVKKIVRSTLSRFGSIYWHSIAGQTVFPVQVSVSHRIPLIIWGAHQGIEQVGMYSHEHEVEMTRRYRKNHDLMGHEADDLITIFDALAEEDIFQYRYPEDIDLQDIGVRGIYLGNYIRWDPIAQHEMMIRRYGYRTSVFDRTFDRYDHVDSYNYMNVHDALKLYKHGFSKVTDHVCREIRHGRLSRPQGIALVREFEHKPFSGISLLAEWLGMDVSSLQWVMDCHRNDRYWITEGPRHWEFNGMSKFFAEDQPEYLVIPQIEILQNSVSSSDTSKSYITIGKGYP